MTDYHTHILPMMDDGSSSVEESVRMLEMLKEQGADTVYLTPHFYINQNLFDEFLLRRSASFELLKKVQTEALPKLKLGAEVYYFEGMTTTENKERLKALKLEDTNYLRLEMPFTKWTERMISNVLELQLEPGFTILMAHIERYFGFVDMKTLFYLKSLGVEFQMNAEYISSGLFHLRAKKLLNSGLISAIGSDAHNLTSRKPNLYLLDKIKDR